MGGPVDLLPGQGCERDLLHAVIVRHLTPPSSGVRPPAAADEGRREDPAVAVVGRLGRGVDPHGCRELGCRELGWPAVGVDPDGDLAGQRVHTCQPGDRVDFFTGQAQALRRLPGHELHGEYAHADEVGAVDPLERGRQHRLDPEEQGAFGRPVAR
jgi:hypothetical protein